MSFLDIFRTYKIFKEGDAVNTCFSICMWGLYSMLAMLIYSKISENNMIDMPFLVVTLFTMSVLLFAFFLIHRDVSALIKTDTDKP